MQYRPIKSLPQYKSYESYLEKLLWNKSRSEGEQTEADLLITLIKKWDEDHGSVSPVLPKPVATDTVKILERLMKEKNINAGKLSSALGMSQSAISDILNYRMPLTNELIVKLAAHFNVDALIFQ